MIGGASTVPAIRYSPDGALVASIDLQVVRLRDELAWFDGQAQSVPALPLLSTLQG